ncbi:MAG TPA: hypothetical protein DCX06_13585 [Opitutae bacterium]|nr:hypothetical protein [Opitutae bacterium]
MSVDLQKLLIIKPSSLGDIIHGLQVVNSIRIHQPNTHVTWVVADAFSPVVESCDAVDEVIVFKRKGGLGSFWRLLQAIKRSGKYDYVLDMQGLARSGLMTKAAISDRKIGRSDAREGAGFFYDVKVPMPSTEQPHAVEILSQFLPAIGLPLEVKDGLSFRLPVPTVSLPETLSKSVLVFPESRREEKNWPYFADFLQAMEQSHPQQVFIWCGSAASASQCPQLANVYNLAGKTSLLDAIALIQKAGAVLANDSGPIHIAAAVGTPVLALFGPTPIESYGPYPIDADAHFTLRSDDHVMASLELNTVCEAFNSKVLPLLNL